VLFAHDTECGLLTAAALVNTAKNGHDTLTDPAALEDFLLARRESGRRMGSQTELRDVITLRTHLRDIWRARNVLAAAGLVNDLLASSEMTPKLTNHDGASWHLHAADDSTPVAQRLRADLALAFADLIRAKASDRLRVCDALDCDAVFVDLSRNRSRRYCDTGNCGNREHVAAYRARRATGVRRPAVEFSRPQSPPHPESEQTGQAALMEPLDDSRHVSRARLHNRVQ
jgi:predicted RNA-binding Zn ribbon-like protein